jgi:predicted nucleic-acid-binding Zn-ribbon protein
MALVRVPFKWNNANFAWETNPFPNQSKNPFTWDDVALLKELAAGGHLDQVFKDEKKKKRFITIWCKVKGYDETKETKEVKDVKITTEDVEMVIKEVLGIDVKVRI